MVLCDPDFCELIKLINSQKGVWPFTQEGEGDQISFKIVKFTAIRAITATTLDLQPSQPAAPSVGLTLSLSNRSTPEH